MHSALILHGCIIIVVGSLVFFVRGKQARREADEEMIRNSVFLANSTLVTAGATEEGSLDSDHTQDEIRGQSSPLVGTLFRKEKISCLLMVSKSEAMT